MTTTRKRRNCRFWAYVNGGPVKITLKPGQRLEHSEGGPTDEGWHCDSTAWEYPADEAAVYREWCSDGRDCDGRLTHSGEDRCPLDQLDAGNVPYVTDEDNHATWWGVIWPDWQEHRNHGGTTNTPRLPAIE